MQRISDTQLPGLHNLAQWCGEVHTVIVTGGVTRPCHSNSRAFPFFLLSSVLLILANWLSDRTISIVPVVAVGLFSTVIRLRPQWYIERLLNHWKRSTEIEMVTDREGLSIGTLIFYLPALFITSYVAYKHGFGRQAGWIFLLLLALVRIIGSICEIVSVSSPSQSVITAFVILSSVGLSPLILAMLGLLKRV